MKVALVYDRVNKWGGAENVLLTLHEIFPEAPLYTSVYNKSSSQWAKVFDVHTSFLQNLPLPKAKHEYYPFLMGIAFESFNFDQFDVVISITHEFAKAVITKPGTLHICYCLTPTSYIWSGFNQYFLGKSSLFKFLAFPMVQYLRIYDKIVCHRPDHYIAISKVVQERIKKFYSEESDLVYPPVNPAPKMPESDEGYFLVVARLVPQKRIDIVVEAFNELGLPLKIVGTGREEQNLRSMAKSNVEFLGGLTASELSHYYNNCHLVIVPAEEDFGLVALEAQSFGKPVLALRAGGAVETIVENETGWFFEKQTVQSLVDKIKEIENKISKIKKTDCVQNAQNFNKERFKKEFKQKIEILLEKN